jgi:hypothetical protein
LNDVTGLFMGLVKSAVFGRNTADDPG